VIENGDNWYGVKERITRSYFKDGNEIESTGWEKVYIPKDVTGSYEEIQLIQSDLSIINSIRTNQLTSCYPNGIPLNDYVRVELIDKALFDKMKKSKVSLLIHFDF